MKDLTQNKDSSLDVPIPDKDKSIPNHETQTIRDPSGKLVTEIGKQEKENA